MKFIAFNNFLHSLNSVKVICINVFKLQNMINRLIVQRVLNSILKKLIICSNYFTSNKLLANRVVTPMYVIY